MRITPLLRAEAVLKLVPAGSHISHQTAAELWGAIVPDDGNTHVWLPSDHRRQVRKGVRSHCGNGPARTTLRKGLPISTPEQTFLDLAAAGLRLVDLVVAADGMIKAGTHNSGASDRGGRGVARPGLPTARRAARPGSEGCGLPPETKLRLLIVLAGLPEPKVNLIVRARDGSWRRRYDLAYKQLRLIVEYDGRQHAQDTQQWLTDIFRREELDQMHWRLVAVTAEGISTDPLQTLVRVREALLDRGAKDLRRSFKTSGGCISRPLTALAVT